MYEGSSCGRPCEFGIFGKTSNFVHVEFCLKRVIFERRFIEDGELWVVLVHLSTSQFPDDERHR